MNIQNGAFAPTGKARPKKTTELFYDSPKGAKGAAGAVPDQGRYRVRPCGYALRRCHGDGLPGRFNRRHTYGHAVNNGKVCRAFAGAAGEGGDSWVTPPR